MANKSPWLVYVSEFRPSNTCTSIARVNGWPGAVIGSDQTNRPAFPPCTMCRHSKSSSKFSYCRSVLITPVGTPVDTIIPSRTVNVFGAQFTLTQPLRSFPLNSATYPSLSAPLNKTGHSNANNIHEYRFILLLGFQNRFGPL